MTKRIWVGLDVGSEATSICVIDDVGAVLQEGTCRTTFEDVHGELRWIRRRRHARIAMEAGSGVSIARGLRTLGYSIDLYETRQLSKFLRARRNKTDAGDANGIAEAGRIGASRVSKVYLKSLECQFLQSQLTIRRQLIRQRVATSNLLRRQIALFGGSVSCSRSIAGVRANIETEIRRLFRGESGSELAFEMRWLLDRFSLSLEHQQAIDRELATFAAQNQVCRQLMSIPGVGPVCALAFYASVGDPHRFTRSHDVGSYLGLTPRLHQSGTTSRSGRITKMGNRATRSYLFQAAMGFLRCAKPNSELRHWAARIEQRRGRKAARIALARKLAVTMIAMWKSGQDFDEDRPAPCFSNRAKSNLVAPNA